MTARHLIVVDLETNGLNIERHQAVEVAWWNLTTDERGRFIPPHSPSDVLGAAEIRALQLNRYIDRIALDAHDKTMRETIRLCDQFWTADPVTDYIVQHTLAGSNPAFDAAFLEKLFARVDLDEHGCEPTAAPWHHRLWDLSAYAAGVLGLDELPGLAKVCELLGIPPGDHTAEGDVTATGLCFRALMARAGGAS